MQSRGQDRQRAPQEHQQRYQSQGDNTDGAGEQDFMRRNFDIGSDGLITGAAGAALGAITARHFGGSLKDSFFPVADAR